MSTNQANDKGGWTGAQQPMPSESITRQGHKQGVLVSLSLSPSLPLSPSVSPSLSLPLFLCQLPGDNALTRGELADTPSE